MPRPGQFVQVQGVRSVLRALEKTRDYCVPAIRAGLEAAANNVLLLAKFYCPIDTGALRESGRVEILDNLGTAGAQLRVQIVFGGKVGFETRKGMGYSAAEKAGKQDKSFAGPEHLIGQVVYYAVYVHENTAVKHDPPTCAKYLERAVRENWQNVSYLMGRHLEEVVKAGTKDGVYSMGKMKITPKAETPKGW